MAVAMAHKGRVWSHSLDLRRTKKKRSLTIPPLRLTVPQAPTRVAVVLAIESRKVIGTRDTPTHSCSVVSQAAKCRGWNSLGVGHLVQVGLLEVLSMGDPSE